MADREQQDVQGLLPQWEALKERACPNGQYPNEYKRGYYHAIDGCITDLQAALQSRAEPATLLDGRQIQHMVDRFLNWRLPDNFCPDAGISFKPDFNEHTSYPMKHEPVGTNLFDATQAEAMVRHMVAGLPVQSRAEPVLPEDDTQELQAAMHWLVKSKQPTHCDVVREGIGRRNRALAAAQSESERLRRLCDERFAQVAESETALAAAQEQIAQSRRELSKHQLCDENGEPYDRWFNPIGQVMFRAGLLACREYMARFVASESPAIAQSIRANWWPVLGADPGAPRQMNWDEVADGDGEEKPIVVKVPPPSIEALPEALRFLQWSSDPAALRSAEPESTDQP